VSYCECFLPLFVEDKLHRISFIHDNIKLLL